MLGVRLDELLGNEPRYFSLENYEGGVARWCPGCGDHGVLSTVQRICRDRQLPPEKIVAVSGIGCSSRFPHYMHAYGFHGLHGRALPVACGVKARRPDLHVWVATGDGDCCSIGAGHWIHAARYNMDLTVMIFDNQIYGLTKKQTSPTTPQGLRTNTHPEGAFLPPLNIIQAMLGFTNTSFVAQTVDWNPLHLHATLNRAYEHRGTSFVRILQRCPAFTADLFQEPQRNPDLILALDDPAGVPLDTTLKRMYKNQLAHDPTDLAGARRLADRTDMIPIGLLYSNPDAPVYDDHSNRGLGMDAATRVRALEQELDHFTV
jgi:2-oxoglutarate ferredoxin oxidoreductase subunit beta